MIDRCTPDLGHRDRRQDGYLGEDQEAFGQADEEAVAGVGGPDHRRRQGQAQHDQRA
ncbi:hypothetical protein [Micromonospora sp. NPDC005979]|uniref:hypothetical protein n=1 Tax=Micromonospora sp. NPDC005979 TaxID=3156726 RepID=UPI0033A09527